MNHFVICLQFHDADRATAMRLARLMADIEPQPRTDVEIVFVARFDTDHDHETIAYVARKFPVHWITTHTKWTGWPGGCNGMAKDTLGWIGANRKDAVGVLMMEPDCVPVKADWLDRLIAEWHAAPEEPWQMGAWRPSGGEHGHLNGNCIMSTKIAHSVYETIGEYLAWDCALAPYLKLYWHKTELIKNCFESLSATTEDLFWAEIGHDAPCLVHGYKDSSAYDLVVKNLLHPDTTELSL